VSIHLAEPPFTYIGTHLPARGSVEVSPVVTRIYTLWVFGADAALLQTAAIRLRVVD
jgi:hypothetical protein